MSGKGKLVTSLLVSIILLDQASKIAVDRTIPLNHSIPVIENLFNLTYIRNTGAAFGIFAGENLPLRRALLFAGENLPLRRALLIGFSVVAIGFVVVLLKRLPGMEKGLIVALTFILAGAIGNLIDRLMYGEVIDFLDFYWSKYHWPAFNFADSFITLGVLATLYRLIRTKGQDPFSPSDS
ncbi:MAG: signal peptidase II [Deltaproteobacteria bacterium]|nr:signal peptidase II [Deltaproteobacteria bacterium]